MFTFNPSQSGETNSGLSLLSAIAEIMRDPAKVADNLKQMKAALAELDAKHKKIQDAIEKERQDRERDEAGLDAKHADLQKRENKLADIGRANAEATQRIAEAKEAQRHLDELSRAHSDREKDIQQRDAALKVKEDDFEKRQKALVAREEKLAMGEKDYRARMSRLKELTA